MALLSSELLVNAGSAAPSSGKAGNGLESPQRRRAFVHTAQKLLPSPRLSCCSSRELHCCCSSRMAEVKRNPWNLCSPAQRRVSHSPGCSGLLPGPFSSITILLKSARFFNSWALAIICCEQPRADMHSSCTNNVTMNSIPQPSSSRRKMNQAFRI